MCGILVANFIDSKFEKALKTLSHRGPDNISVKKIDSNLMGHTRLAIIDLSPEANQPMEFEDAVVVFNGEIYNYKELAVQENLKMKTKSDTEVILRLYLKYGHNFLNKLNGMFAFCIYDRKKQTFFCARDRYGKKPLFYYFKDEKFIVTSEIKGILKLLNFIPELNEEALYDYLTYWTTLGEKTFYMDVKKLQPGYCMFFEKNGIKLKKWYSLEKNITEIEDGDYLEKIEKLIFDSVKLRLRSDVEVASLLSGGVDSSLISYIYSKISGKRINTFSIGYNEHSKYNEIQYAKKVSKLINSNHFEIIISKDDFVEALENFLYYFDEPFADSAAIPTFLLTKKIKDEGIKVALSGEGSDEIFLGYDKYFSIKENSRFRGFQETFTEEEKEIFIKNYKSKTYFKLNIKNISLSKLITLIDFQVWLQEVLLTKIDRMSMANSVEIRAPFLDYRLVEYVVSLPDKIRMGSSTKSLLKSIAIKYLPEEIVYRRKKGFSFPFMEWLLDVYGIEVLNLIFKINKELGIFNNEFVEKIYNMAKKGKSKQYLWCLFIFCLWFEKVYLKKGS